MILGSKKKQNSKSGYPSSNEPISLYRNLISFQSLFKMIFIGMLIAIVFFLISVLDYYEETIYFPIIVILIITFFFLLWIITLYLFFTITGTTAEKTVLSKLFPLLIVMSVLSAYFAIVVENKSFTLVSVFSALFSQLQISEVTLELIQVIFYVFIIPFIEEIAKVFPIIILMGNYARIRRKDKLVYTSLTPSFRLIVLFGAFFGGWFDLFEQFLSYSTTSSETVIISLIFGRSIYPLHGVATMITAFGLGWIYINRKRWNKKLKTLVFSVFLVFSTGFHGLWNYYSVANIDSDVSTIFFQILGYISYVLYAFFLFWILLRTPKLCSTCNTEHKRGFCPAVFVDFKLIEKKVEDARNMDSLYESDSPNSMICSECRNTVYNSKFCLNCWSFPKLQCENCNQVVPAFTRLCWSCGSELPTLYDKMTSSSPPFFVSIAAGFTRILGAGILISFIFAFATLENTISYLGNTIFLLSIMLTLFITIAWYYFGENRVKSMLSSINILSIVAISVIIMSLYLLVFSILMIISIVQIVIGLIALSCLLILIIMSIYYLRRVMRGARLVIV